MESKNSEKIQEINIIAQKTLKKASENRNLCESFYESDTKQGTVTNTAFSLLQKQFQACKFFCGVLEKRISLLIDEASNLLSDDKEVLSKFEDIVNKLSNKKYRETSLYDYANVEENHNNEAKKEISEIEKFVKTLETMRSTTQVIMAELVKCFLNWKALFDEIHQMVISPNEIQKNYLLALQEKIDIEIEFDRLNIDSNGSDGAVEQCKQKLETLTTLSNYLQSATETYLKKEEKFKTFFNEGNNLNDFFHFYLDDCHYFYQTTNKLASVLRAHYDGYKEFFEKMRDNTSKYESSLDAFDKWAEEYERKTQSIQEMKLVIEECEKKLNEMARVEMEKREKFEKEYAKFLPDELMIECPIPTIKVCFDGKSNRYQGFRGKQSQVCVSDSESSDGVRAHN